MSVFIEFIVPDVSGVECLREVLVAWGGELASCSPPRFAYESLAFTVVPITSAIESALPHALRGNERCLALEEAVAMAWSAGALDPKNAEALRSFIQAVARVNHRWAAVIDPDTGPPSRTVVVAAQLFDELTKAVEPARSVSGAVVLVIEAAEHPRDPTTASTDLVGGTGLEPATSGL